VIELSARYIELFETITGESFSFPDSSQNINERLAKNLAPHMR
ncbi:MAG TPA: phosphoribosylaminoimidazolesuccinocarboxamide synthase, partial [Opitutae bacterium]|nr:phosphoribosylaminoimidazolesuccinocarboxamide synthase [Opitutae bacterium]